MLLFVPSCSLCLDSIVFRSSFISFPLPVVCLLFFLLLLTKWLAVEFTFRLCILVGIFFTFTIFSSFVSATVSCRFYFLLLFFLFSWCQCVHCEILYIILVGWWNFVPSEENVDHKMVKKYFLGSKVRNCWFVAKFTCLDNVKFGIDRSFRVQ